MFTTEETVTVLCGLCSILMGYLTFGSSGILFVVAIICIMNTMFDFETMDFVTANDRKRRRQVEADAAYAREVHRKEVRRQQKARDARFERQRMADVRLLQQQAVEQQHRQRRRQRQQERKRQREALQRDAQRREAHRRRMVEEEANRHGARDVYAYRHNLARANGLPSNYFDDY